MSPTMLLCIDGQRIAKKLSHQVTKETKKLTTLLEEYNVCQLLVSSSSTQIHVTLDEALDPDVLSCKLHTECGATSSKPQDVIEAYLQMTRSNEEIVLLENEMLNTIQFYAEQRKSLLLVIDQMKEAQLSESNAFRRGAVALLHSLFRRTDKLYQQCRVFPISAANNIPQQLDVRGYEADSGVMSGYDSDSSDSDEEADY